jgi:BirA family biotin operon repressor/biotin-[acetyl-CoA-carboxylase] ligase
MEILKDALGPDEILDGLCASKIGRKIVVFKSTSSTNDIAWQYSLNKENNGIVVFAEEQNAGRGRRGNKWYAGFGKSLLFSALILDCKISREMLPLVSAVAVAESVSDFGGKGVQVKWPNDVMVDGKKIAGVLVEFRGNDAVIGIGINCHQQKADFPDELKESATSVDMVLGGFGDRRDFARKAIENLEKWLDISAKDRQKVLDKWQMLSSLLGKMVGVEYNNQHFYGNCIGVDPQKGLILQLERGGVRMFDAAHTSILK